MVKFIKKSKTAFFVLFFGLLTFSVLNSCEKKSNDDETNTSAKETENTSTKLEVNPTTLSFGTATDYKTVSISTKGSWSVNCSETWCTVSPLSGEGNGSILVMVLENNSADAPVRNGTITVTQGKTQKKITVTQAGQGGSGGNYDYAPCSAILTGTKNGSSAIITWTFPTSSGCGTPTNFVLREVNYPGLNPYYNVLATSGTSYTITNPKYDESGIAYYEMEVGNDKGRASSVLYYNGYSFFNDIDDAWSNSLPAPTGLYVSQNQNGDEVFLYLAWDPVSRAAEYEIMWSINLVDFYYLFDPPTITNTTCYVSVGNTKGIIYFCVRAINGNVESLWSVLSVEIK
jgi:hypothetical protein